MDAVGKAAHHQVLTCLPPWMDNLSFAARWEGPCHLCFCVCVKHCLPGSYQAVILRRDCHVIASRNGQEQNDLHYHKSHLSLVLFLLSLEMHAGNWSERLLESMYYVTAQHGTVFPHEIERLWSTVAGNKRNIIPILDYVVSKGQQECGQASLCSPSNSFPCCPVRHLLSQAVCIWPQDGLGQCLSAHLVYSTCQQPYQYICASKVVQGLNPSLAC